jgi:AbrB family looped-hinge helix DNA binding protein
MKYEFAEVDRKGRLILPAAIAASMGLAPGSRFKVRQAADRLILHRPVTRIARVYVEPTTRCNLQCRTCMRNVWDERIGDMEKGTFDRILDGVRALAVTPRGARAPKSALTVFFGGLGEPLVHPDIVQMVRKVKKTGASAELITNGILLTEDLSAELIEAGLDMLWVSLDGASPECYTDVRPGNHLPRVVENLKGLRDLKIARGSETPRIGVSFVAMKRNLSELPEVLRLGYRVGVRRFLVTNVYPHTAELLEEILYRRSLGESVDSRSTVKMPRMDMNKDTARIMETVIDGYYGAKLEGIEILWPSDACPFVMKGSVCVRWDGKVSPCLPLLHAHQSYLGDRLRASNAYWIGSVLEHGLPELWSSPEYVRLRKRLEEFDFSPCTSCNSCEMANDNEKDCFGNMIPTCGGCLWAQGFIQCP